MSDIEKRALALVNEACRSDFKDLGSTYRNNLLDALLRAIEQHEAFRQEVSDAIDSSVLTPETEAHLSRFIIAKPDPLVEAWKAQYPDDPLPKASCENLRAALAARGLKIVEVSHD